ncbi:hypothetical protein [Sediminibacterium sp.]|uniref:hypothetical protein n=1 Tax=Sediminibacterium sp. TaxID=1917865 RepID=UPI00272FF807|nr:hypothetical protein [Sediminibacterium sp.]MDP2422481.1 hypothetical protein [Sediminibacterium sp.]
MPKLNAKALYKKLTDTGLIIIFASAILFYFISCNKKDFRTNDKNNFNTEVKTDVLKGWMNSKISNSVGYEKEFIDSITRIIEWGEIKGIIVSSTKEILYLPLKNSTVGVTFFYDFKSNQIDSCNLVLVKHLNNSKHEYPILGVASYYRTYLLKYNNTIDFTGTVTFYSLTNKFQEDFGFKKGNIFKRGFIAPKLNLQNENKIKSNQQWDGCAVWGHFTLWSDGTITLDYTYLVCSDCQTASVNLRTGNHFLKSNCGGGGGGGGEIINYEIWNKISDSCLKVLVDRLVNSANRVSVPLAQPLIRDILTENFFSIYNINNSPLKNKNLVFLIDVNIDRPAKYITNPNFGLYLNGNLIQDTILINPNRSINASQEYYASIVLHEIAHSILERSGLFSPDIRSTQHELMAFNYVNQLSLSIRSFFPNISLTSANSLALQGLGERVYRNEGFSKLINTFGFNDISSSSNHWAYMSSQYENNNGNIGKSKCEFQ